MSTVFRDAILGAGYHGVVKPIFFRFDPERVHNGITNFGSVLGGNPITRGLTKLTFGYEHPMLRTNLFGIELTNPIGLSAGFDKEGMLVDILPAVGFGFMEIGSVTGTPSPGNPRPRLWRLPKSKALVVYMGLNSSGAETVANRLRRKRMRFPWALSIAKANLPELDGLEEGIADYVRAAKALDGIGAMRVINISCPNTTGGEPFQQAEHLERLLQAVMPVMQSYPVLIKLPAANNLELVDGIVEVAMRHGVRGFICTNLSKDRANPAIKETAVPPNGGISGKVVETKSNEILAHVYRRTKGQATLIGVGGVFNADDAYRKIRLGASAVSLITGMIYQGPSVISEIKRGLVSRLKRDGFRSITDAVGIDAG